MRPVRQAAQLRVLGYVNPDAVRLAQVAQVVAQVVRVVVVLVQTAAQVVVMAAQVVDQDALVDAVDVVMAAQMDVSNAAPVVATLVLAVAQAARVDAADVQAAAQVVGRDVQIVAVAALAVTHAQDQAALRRAGLLVKAPAPIVELIKEREEH